MVYEKIDSFLESGFSITIIILFIVHLVILSIYIQLHINDDHSFKDSDSALLLAGLIINSRDKISNEQLITTINSLNQRKLMFNNHQLKITISNQPIFSIRFNADESLSFIQKNLGDTPHKNFSYKINSNQWLNYSENHVFSPYKFAVLLSFFELLILGFIAFYIISLRRFLIPLNHFKKSADSLGIDISTPLPTIHGPKVVRETALAMQKMQDRIIELIQARTKLLASISHDLRTPITRLKLRSQFIDRSAIAQKFSADLDEMEDMIDSILTFTSEDFLHRQKNVFDINSLLSVIYEDLTERETNIYLSLSKKRLPVFGSPLAMKRALTNLVQNALNHGKCVWLKTLLSFNQIIVTIEDDGPGIAVDLLEKVFQPYYRAPTSANNTNGAGLGLTIANEIIRSHFGKITLANRPTRGLIVTVSLPLFSAK